MPTELRRLCGRGKVHALVATLLGLLLLLVAAAGILVTLESPQQADPCRIFDSYQNGTYLYIRPDYASKNLTPQEEKQGYFLLFWWDEQDNLACCAVRGDRELTRALTDLRYYTYSGGDRPSQRITVRGAVTPLPQDLRQAMVDEYNYLVEGDDVTLDDFDDWFAPFCLDTAYNPIDLPLLVAFGVLGVAALVWMIVAGRARKRVKRQNQRTLSMVHGLRLGDAARQLAAARAYPASGMYLGEEFLYSSSTGLILVDRATVKSARLRHGEPGAKGRAGKAGYAALELTLADDRTRLLPWLRCTQEVEMELEDLAARTPDPDAAARRAQQQRAAAEAAAARAATAATAPPPPPRPAYTTGGTPAYTALQGGSGYTRTVSSAGPASTGGAPAYTTPAWAQLHTDTASGGLQVEPPRAQDGTAQQPNRGRGLLGAALGCLLGAAAWVLLGVVGDMISGWVGLLIIWLALTFYKKFAGGLDKRGAVITMVMAVLTIFPATFLIYVIPLLGECSFPEACAFVWGVLPEMPELLGNMALALFLTLLVGIPMCRSVLDPEWAQRLYTPARQMQPDGTLLVQPPKGSTASRVVMYVFGVLWLLLGVLVLLIPDGQDVRGVSVMFLVLAAVFLGVGVGMTRSQAHVSIHCDENGLRWIKGGRRTLEISWEQVTELRVSKPMRMRITAPQGKVNFSQNWPGGAQLRQLAIQKATNARYK